MNQFPVNLSRLEGVSDRGPRRARFSLLGVDEPRDLPRRRLMTYSLLIPCFCTLQLQKPAIHAGFCDARKKFPVIFPVIEHQRLPNMRKIIVNLATSADGYVARPDGNLDWLTERPAPKGFYSLPEFERSIDAKILGRKTFDRSLELGARFGERAVHYVFSR